MDQARFDDACARLMELVLGSYTPTLLVGIRTGGLVVAETMARSAGPTVEVVPLTCRRAATAAKARLPFLRTTLKALPGRVTDALRVAELRLSAPGRRSRGADTQQVDRTEASTIGERLGRERDGARLLVVDDAVDSGATLATVLVALRGVAPAGSEIRSAAITVTLDNPLAQPDFTLYRRVLCRFPWSFDAAG